MRKQFKVYWKQFHEAYIDARDEKQAETIALGLHDVDTLKSVHPVVVELEVIE